MGIDAKNPDLDRNGIRILITLLEKGSTNLSGLKEAVLNLSMRKRTL